MKMPLIQGTLVKGLLRPYKEPTDGAGRRGLIQKGFVCVRSPWKPHQKVSPMSVTCGCKNPGRFQTECADVPQSEWSQRVTKTKIHKCDPWSFMLVTKFIILELLSNHNAQPQWMLQRKSVCYSLVCNTSRWDERGWDERGQREQNREMWHLTSFYSAVFYLFIVINYFIFGGLCQKVVYLRVL